MKPFESNKFERIFNLNSSTLRPNAALAWEANFAELQGGLTEDAIKQRPQLKRWYEFVLDDSKNKIILFKTML